MKILTVFGSASDQPVSAPLVDRLRQDHDVEFTVLSAHRDPEALHDKVTAFDGDVVVAGAGLAAALPGVVAAMTQKPVFGVAVPAQFGGLDAVAAIAQMPPGVPVIACAPGKEESIAEFLRACAGHNFAQLHVVAAEPRPAELDAEIAKVKDADITVGAAPDATRFNIYIVAKPEDVRPDAFGLHVPFLPKAEAALPENYLRVFQLMQHGGLWVGTNNLRNAAAAAKRLTGLQGAAALPPLLYEGSVKNVRGTLGATPYVFEFSDRYSIFDWGSMPDNLTGKGAALAWMARFFFDHLGSPATWRDWTPPAGLEADGLLEDLRKHGLAHHALPAAQQPQNPRCLAVRPVAVPRPESRVENGALVWDYSAYRPRPENTLVPLEVIFRFGVPEGSSLLQRTGDTDYRRTLGLTTPPAAGDRFDLPVVEFSTKLETSDRYLTYDTAREIAGLAPAEFDRLKKTTQLAALRLRDVFAEIGLELWDGKLEFAFAAIGSDDLRGFMLVDSIGPDELRLTRDGVHLSKEALRGFYRTTSWHTQLEAAKKLAAQRGEKDWKKICREELQATPPALPAAVRLQAEMIYAGIARALAQLQDDNNTFPQAWPLDDIAKSFLDLKRTAA